MVKYIKSFKDYIPTWIICIFTFFGIFIWPLVIAVILLILQMFQRKKIIANEKEYIKEINDLQAINLSIKKNEEEQKKNIQEILERKEKQIQIQKYNLEKMQIALDEKEIQKMKEPTQDKTDRHFVLCAGKYKGGIDLPVGVYNLKVISGEGDIKTDKPENIYENVSSDINHGYGFLNTYRNLEISEDTTLKISASATIEFDIAKKYDYSKEIEESKQELINQIETIKSEYEKAKSDLETQKRILEGEIYTIKSELKTLNDEAIRKYYKFSDYSNLTSEDCKNKLLMLKKREQELRENGEDVVIHSVYNRKPGKTGERVIRQILRTFNAECDNIMMNVSTKNIDKARKQIQNSYDTLNRLYAVDYGKIQKDLLELKLEQITLMYTYELKYQQEKDIQRAIKEQMAEEAKAQREIEEQKKKIEKDLQQHLGEVNRLMKYMQKSQIDAEKQLYMDKIKELEEKIKELESDKETVLQREANAKAGFVYIISNIGSFGENIYKIGMTRRLEPMDRIKELSSASVPFEFDVHAMIFSSDAPELETTLHRYFADKAVNKVNPRKEFYNVDIDEIERVVKENYNDTVQFVKVPIAAEYRQSLNMA